MLSRVTILTILNGNILYLTILYDILNLSITIFPANSWKKLYFPLESYFFICLSKIFTWNFLKPENMKYRLYFTSKIEIKSKILEFLEDFA